MPALPRLVRTLAVGVLAGSAVLVAGTSTASAATVTTEAELRTQFADVTATSITLANDISLTDCQSGDLFRGPTGVALTLDGGGFTISQTCAGQRVMETQGADGLTLRSVTITGGNVAGAGGSEGGGVLSSTRGPLTLDHAIVTGNRADGDTGGLGGGIESGGDLTLISSTISNNHAGGGASIFSGLGGGGAGGTVMATDSTISGNVSEGSETSGGDAAATFGNSPQTFIRSTISGNRSTAGTTSGSGSSAGIAVNDDVTLVNSTVTGNVAEGPASTGAGVGSGGRITLVYSTVSGNSSALAPANVGFHGPDGDEVSVGSVIANPLGGGANCSGVVGTSQGHNFSDDATCGFTNTAAGDQESAGDPMLGALGDNGGPTQTLLPLAGSPLLDAIAPADCQAGAASGVTTDQRGTTRPQGTGCDIGAVEVFVAVTTTTVAGATTVPGATTTTAPGTSPPATPVGAQPTFTG